MDKQHLRIKAFYGTIENAVKAQIWIAISVYVLVAIMKKRMQIDLSLYTILQILSITFFEKKPISQVLTISEYKKQITNDHIRMKFPAASGGVFKKHNQNRRLSISNPGQAQR